MIYDIFRWILVLSPRYATNKIPSWFQTWKNNVLILWINLKIWFFVDLETKHVVYVMGMISCQFLTWKIITTL
jgi:hypothetical protein